MFWLEIGMFLVILFTLTSLVKFSLRKLFKIKKEKKDWFSYNYINKKHQKVDRFVRNGSMIGLIVISYLVIFKEYSIMFYLVPLILLMAADYSVRAFFEWKYSDNPKQSILTVSEMIIFIAAIAVIIQFSLLRLAQ